MIFLTDPYIIVFFRGALISSSLAPPSLPPLSFSLSPPAYLSICLSSGPAPFKKIILRLGNIAPVTASDTKNHSSVLLPSSLPPSSVPSLLSSPKWKVLTDGTT